MILACLDRKEHRRNFMIAANLNNMVGNDYVYLLIQTSATGFGNAKEMFLKLTYLRKGSLLRFA